MFEAANFSELKQLGLDASPVGTDHIPKAEEKQPLLKVTEEDPLVIAVSPRCWPCLWLGGD